MRTLLILLVVFSLAGCASRAEIAAADDAKCQGYGARPGDQAYVQCRAQLDAARTTARAIIAASPN